MVQNRLKNNSFPIEFKRELSTFFEGSTYLMNTLFSRITNE